MGFLLRWIFAFLLVAATFNPTEWNFITWTGAHWATGPKSLAVLFGLVLLVGYIIYLRATLRSIGAIGAMIVAALVASLLWVASDFGILQLDNAATNTWLGIFALSIVLGIGLNWSRVRRRLSGQADVDDVEE